MLSDRITSLPPSETLAMNARAAAKRRAGERVYNLTVGEPAIRVSPLVSDAVVRALEAGKTQYPPVAGIVELRDAASSWMNASFGSVYDRTHTLVTTGGKFGLYLLFQALLNPGDEVVIIAPYWVSYPSMVELAGGRAIVVQTTEAAGWKVSPDDIRSACNEKTKALIINNASNPTGVVYTREEVEQLMLVAQEKNIFVISDEVYSGLVYDNQPFISCASFVGKYGNIAVVQSASKNFAMTGMRVGFVFANPAIISALEIVQGQSTSGAATICQWAALAAIEHADSILPDIRTVMQHRRDVFVQTWNSVFHTPIKPPQSALYAFVSLADLGLSGSSTQACLELLERGNIALVPGAPFGAEGYVRISFGDTEDELIASIHALHHFLNNA